jgi:hypothetical protein
MNPEDWNLATMTTDDDQFDIIGLLGPAGSGKDLTADWFCHQKNFAKVAFADPIKRFAQKAFNLPWEQLWGPSEKRNEVFIVNEQWWFEAIGHFGEASTEIVQDVLEDGLKTEGYMKLHDWLTQLRKDYSEQISARVILQTLGTEWGRSVDGLMWAKYAHKVANSLRNGKGTYHQIHGVSPEQENKYAGIVIHDHRFKNEVEITQQQKGYVLRLRRLELEKKNDTVGIVGHRSEAEQKTIPDSAFNLVLEFEEGVEKVYATLEVAYKERSWTVKQVPSPL